jgi:hypothetical protein
VAAPPIVALAAATCGRVVAAQRPMQPAYLNEMPSVERVKAVIRGKDRLDTAARHASPVPQDARSI